MAAAGIELAAVDAGSSAYCPANLPSIRQGRHPAALNFGDCFSYAPAKATRFPLLFKGDDFGKSCDKARIPAGIAPGEIKTSSTTDIQAAM
jgi:ribonuclease VapC